MHESSGCFTCSSVTVFLILAILVGFRCMYFIVVLILLMTIDIENFFRCLFAVSIISSLLPILGGLVFFFMTELEYFINPRYWYISNCVFWGCFLLVFSFPTHIFKPWSMFGEVFFFFGCPLSEWENFLLFLLCWEIL